MNLKLIAERIEALAKAKYGSTNKMVDASDGTLSSSVVNNMKRPKASVPSIKVFEKIAKLLDVSVDFLLTGKDSSQPASPSSKKIGADLSGAGAGVAEGVGNISLEHADTRGNGLNMADAFLLTRLYDEHLETGKPCVFVLRDGNDGRSGITRHLTGLGLIFVLPILGNTVAVTLTDEGLRLMKQTDEARRLFG